MSNWIVLRSTPASRRCVAKQARRGMNAPAFFKTRSFFRLVIDVPGLVCAQRAILSSVGK